MGFTTSEGAHGAKRLDRIMAILYRGLAVATDESASIIDSIKEMGLQRSERAYWSNTMPNPRCFRQRVVEWQNEPSTIRGNLLSLPTEPLMYACGDVYGGSFYALEHNNSVEKPVSILVEFEAPCEALAVDGKDFLHTVFQLWDRDAKGRRDLIRSTLAEAFGARILFYFDRAATFTHIEERLGLCDAACYDLDVVTAHHANKCLIAGRCKTQFCSSFQLQLPIPPTAIKDVVAIHAWPAAPGRQISLHDLIH